MSVRCKFKVQAIEKTPDGKQANINMYPVCSQDPNSENGQYWQYTPGGQFQINCVNEAAFSQFEVGNEYYIDITPAPVAVPADQPAAEAPPA